ncbi:MAG: PASTA domain-containing protein [Flavobacteriales bacterium]
MIQHIKSLNFKKIILYFCGTGLLFLLISLLGLKTLSIYTQHGEVIEVPDLINQRQSEFSSNLDALDLSYEIIDSGAYNPSIQPGGVIEQVPKALAGVKSGRTIYLTLNPSSPGFVNFPDFKDKQLRRLVSYARATGLIVETISYKNDIADFVVLDVTQNGKKVEANQRLAKGSKLEVLVGKTAGKLCSAPSVSGMSKLNAFARIQSAGLNIGTVRIDEKDKHVNPLELVVYKQEPLSARREIYSAGRGINLWLKKREYLDETTDN